ncbi:MAG: hypothetical protein AB1403_09690, partial [Candidatus Riflebacteria bacterium]
MHYDQYAKVLGDSLFEAKVKAEKMYGKDSFTVLSSRKVKHSIYLGLGYKEMFEITIGISNTSIKERKNVVTEVPLRPSPSIEISSSNLGSQIEKEISSTVKIPAPTRKVEPPVISAVKPVSASLHGINAYSAAQKPVSMRNVHGLRSNQEGSEEPHPQKLLDNRCIEPEQIDDILSELMQVKETRKRQEKISGAIGKTQPAAPTTNLKQNEDPRYDTIDKRINDVLRVLHTLTERVGVSIDREIPDMPEGLFHIKKKLLQIETPLEIVDQLVFELKDELPLNVLQRPEQALQYTSRWLEKKLKFSSDPVFNEAGPKVIALIGPTGVGKTTTIAKIAASYGLSFKNRLSIALFTLDTYRIGATDQLRQYAQVIGVEMEILYSPEDIEAAISRHLDKDLIIVDTAGRCQKDAKELHELRKFLDRLPSTDKYLV